LLGLPEPLGLALGDVGLLGTSDLDRWYV